MEIGIIGAGKVGTALAIVFKKNGFDVYISSRRRESANRAAKLSGAISVSMPEAAKKDVVFLSVPDSEIVSTAFKIANNLQNHQTVLHLSGAFSSEIIQFLPCAVGSLHPLKSFADPITAAQTIKNTLFTFDGEENAFKKAHLIVNKIGCRIIKIKQKDKPIYHLAAVITANYTTTLFYLSEELLKSIGFSEKESRSALMSLLDGVLNNIKNKGPIDALTGPILRGDADTIKLHLKNINNDNLKTIYKSLAFATLTIAEQRGLSKAKIKKIIGVINE